MRLALEGLPYLIDALAVTAEAALRKFVRSAQPALQTADLRLPAPNRESVSSLRRRRSALVLLAEFGISLLFLVEMKHQAILDLLGQHPIRIRQ